MYNNVLQNIENIAIWPVISFVIFFLFFLCLLWWVFTVDKKFIKYMEDLPLGQASLPSGQTSLPMGQTSLPTGQATLPYGPRYAEALREGEQATLPSQDGCTTENKSSPQN